MNNTTRCFPRRLEDAFSKDPQNAEWFYPPEKTFSAYDIFLWVLSFVLYSVIGYLLLKT